MATRTSKLEKTIAAIDKKSNIKMDRNSINKYMQIVNDEEFLANLIIKIDNSRVSIDGITLDTMLALLLEFYPTIVKSKEDLNLFNNICDRYLKNYERNTLECGLIRRDIIEKISIAFDDKKLILETIDYLISFTATEDKETPRKFENINKILDYLVLAREYFVEDRALFASFVNLVNKVGKEILLYGVPEEIDVEMLIKIEEDKKANGIYDIDQAKLAEYDRKIESLGILKEKLETLISLAGTNAAELEKALSAAKREINNVVNAEIRDLKNEGNLLLQQFETKYLALVNEEKEGILKDRDTLIADMQAIIDQRKLDFLTLSDDMQKTIGIEISRLHTTATSSIDRITDFVNNDENVQRIVAAHQSNSDFLNRVEVVNTVASKMGITGDSQNVANVGQIFVSQPDLGDSAPVDYTINYYFDRSVKYKERFKELMEKKAKLEEKGEIFHEKFDDILTMILQNDTPYIYGPSGCGKTYLIKKQIPKLLGSKVVRSGFISFEQDVLGYTNAGNGGYVPSIFYRAYKYGDIMLFDELDKSKPNAANILLPFLERDEDADFTFPNGVNLKRHPNFRIVTAGNTILAGLTAEHNTSQKLDEAVNQRLMPIEISFDNRIEEGILKDYQGWLEFIKNYRTALENTKAGENQVGTFTSRDAQDIKDHLDDESFTDEKLMSYHIIETKDDDYLSQILSRLEKSQFKTPEGKKLLKIYKEQADRKKKR